MNNANIEPSLFMHAIHGKKNPELIHLLEESVEPINDEIHEKSLIESIKCCLYEGNQIKCSSYWYSFTL